MYLVYFYRRSGATTPDRKGQFHWYDYYFLVLQSGCYIRIYLHSYHYQNVYPDSRLNFLQNEEAGIQLSWHI